MILVKTFLKNILFACYLLLSTSAFCMDPQAKIYVAGHNGLVGRAIIRALLSAGYSHIITRNSSELDLRNQQAVNDFFEQEQPDYVFLAAAKVGGIHANNTYPAEFIYDNLAIQTNVIHAAYTHHVKKLLFLGSSCIYPRDCPQPIKEEYLLTSPLEKTNEAYAIAKIAGLKLCEYYNKQYGTNFIAVMPTNLYGPYDNFDLNSSHVIPALIRKIYTAQQNNNPQCEVWGTGNPRREFLHVDDLAQALLLLMNSYDGNGIVNIGSGQDLPIRELVAMIKDIVGYQGEMVWNSSKPDGTPRKLLDISRMTNLGWKPRITLPEGIAATLLWCQNNGIFN
ncbi:MAG TPA: GDP-L-fucose synthase [Candidatus Babeliales bacterium]|nr:GDP-L-fucose synthase [Candidatus Babeliales bacterium]